MTIGSSTPDPTGRRSSVVNHPATEAKPSSSVAEILPAPDPSDNSPTVISMNRPGVNAEAVVANFQGKQLGQFELIEPIGVGGMAAVIRAKDVQLGRIVAL